MDILGVLCCCRETVKGYLALTWSRRSLSGGSSWESFAVKAAYALLEGARQGAGDHYPLGFLHHPALLCYSK